MLFYQYHQLMEECLFSLKWVITLSLKWVITLSLKWIITFLFRWVTRCRSYFCFSSLFCPVNSLKCLSLLPATQLI